MPQSINYEQYWKLRELAEVYEDEYLYITKELIRIRQKGREKSN